MNVQVLDEGLLLVKRFLDQEESQRYTEELLNFGRKSNEQRDSAMTSNVATVFNPYGKRRVNVLSPELSCQWIQVKINDCMETLQREYCSQLPLLNFHEQVLCRVNHYPASTSKIGWHCDVVPGLSTDDYAQINDSIASVSLGASANFCYKRDRLQQRSQEVLLEHGDLLVFGGPSRWIYHSVQGWTAGSQPSWANFHEFGECRFNVTWRKKILFDREQKQRQLEEEHPQLSTRALMAGIHLQK